jgi:excisionase family DNA binding protein
MAKRSKDDKILDTADIAKFFGVTEDTVALWCRSGRLPAFKLGGRWRMRQSDLQKIIKQKIHWKGELPLTLFSTKS